MRHDADVVLHLTDHHFLDIHQRFWDHGEDIFDRCRARIPDLSSSELDCESEMLELAVIDLPGGSEQFTTQVPKLLVVPTYETFWNVLNDENQRWQGLLQTKIQTRFLDLCHATIVTGQPGIG